MTKQANLPSHRIYAVTKDGNKPRTEEIEARQSDPA